MIFPLLIGCEIEYDGETKLVVKGKLLNENNEAINNQEINLFVERSSSSIPFIFYLPSESNFIGKTKTNENGEYTMVIPKPTSNYSEIILTINDLENQYNKKQYRNIKIDNFINYEFNLGTTKLYQKTNLSYLNVTLNQITPYYQLQKIEYIGAFANEIEYVNPLEENYIYFETNVLVKKNQTVVIKYTVKNYSTNENLIFEQNVIIGNENETNYILNY